MSYIVSGKVSIIPFLGSPLGRFQAGHLQVLQVRSKIAHLRLKVLVDVQGWCYFRGIAFQRWDIIDEKIKQRQSLEMKCLLIIMLDIKLEMINDLT